MSVIACSGLRHVPGQPKPPHAGTTHGPWVPPAPHLGTIEDPPPAPWATWGYLCDICRQTTPGGLIPRPTHP